MEFRTSDNKTEWIWNAGLTSIGQDKKCDNGQTPNVILTGPQGDYSQDIDTLQKSPIPGFDFLTCDYFSLKIVQQDGPVVSFVSLVSGYALTKQDSTNAALPSVFTRTFEVNCYYASCPLDSRPWKGECLIVQNNLYIELANILEPPQLYQYQP